MYLNSKIHVYSYNYSAYPTLTLNKEVFKIDCDNGNGATDAIYSYVPMICSRDIKINGITVGNGGTSYLAGSLNTCFGKDTLLNCTNTTNPHCCAVGNSVLTNCTTGRYNTAISNYGALYVNITGSSNTAVGNRVLEKSLSSFNTGLGDSAGWNLSNGDYLTASGYKSGYLITTGTLNYCFGSNAYATTNFSKSSAFGSDTVINGNNATALGYGAVAGANQVVLGTASETVICPNTLSVSALITGSNGLTVSAGTSALKATTTTTLTSSDLITGSNGLTISAGSSSLQSLTTSGLLTANYEITVGNLTAINYGPIFASALIQTSGGATINGGFTISSGNVTSTNPIQMT